MAVRMLIHTDTYIAGEPVAAGSDVEVAEDLVWRLLIRGTVQEGEPAAPEGGGEEIRHWDPVAIHRDPKGKRGK
jgi:hypothetical protein